MNLRQQISEKEIKIYGDLNTSDCSTDTHTKKKEGIIPMQNSFCLLTVGHFSKLNKTDIFSKNVYFYLFT